MIKTYNKRVRDRIPEIIEAGYSREELGRIRADKAEKRGGFEKRLLLIDVEED